MGSMRALVTANRGDDDLGLVGERLIERGYHLSTLHREEHGAWPELATVDLVVSLGSEWSVYWDHVAEPVEAECALLRAAHERGVPVLGICFGSQLLAHALGGEVTRAPVEEIGWSDVTATADGDATLAGSWFQWHYDRWTPPAQATLLAANDRANQAFSIGRTLAVQFHPEVTANIVKHWLESGGAAELVRVGIDRDALEASLEAREPTVRRRTHALVDRFCDHIATSAVVP